MASSISYDSTIRDGLAVNPPLIASGGKIGAFAVLAHQIDWRQTTFANNNIMDYDGDSTTEKLLNAIESYICNHNMTGNVNGNVTGDVTGNTYGTVFGDTVNAFLTTIKQDTDHNSTYYISLVNKTSGSSYTYVDSDGLYYNPNTDTISTKNISASGNVTIAGKLSIDDSTKVVNLNADMLDGMHISGIDNKYWGTITYVKGGDGVMEIGKYIDFHHNKEGETDYSTRIESQNTSTKNTIKLPSNDGTLHVGDFIKSDAGDKELDTTTSATDGLAVLTGLSFDTTTGKVSYCTHDIYHGNSGITAGTYGLDAYKTYTLNNCQFFVPEFTVNAQGHIIAASENLITISPNTEDVASKIHTHTLTPSGSITGSSHSHTFNMVNGTSSENGSHNHTFTGSEVTTSSISGAKSFYEITGVGSVPSRAQVTVASSDHTHKLTATGDVNVELNQTSTASGKPDSTNITSVAAGDHIHVVVGAGKHTPSGTITSTFTGVEVANHSHTTSGTAASSGAHTHTLSGTSSSNGAHTHTLSGTSSSNGAHTHTTSGTAASAGAHTHTSQDTLIASEANGILTITFTANATTSAGAHTHTTSGTAASAGAHTHTYSATTSSAGAHTHTYSATTSSAGAHTHTTSGTAADAGKHTPSGTVTSTFTGNEVAAHSHIINKTGTGSILNIPNADHTHNYYKATVKSASFTGNEVTTGTPSATKSFYEITGVGSTPSRAQVTVASSDHTHKLTATGTISNNGAHTHTYTYISSINNAAPTLTFTGTSAITTSTPSATTTVVIK